MKMFYIFTFFLIGNPMCFSQIYRQLVKEDRHWVYHFRQSEPGNCNLLWITHGEIHYFGKDTTINNRTYKPLIVSTMEIDLEKDKVIMPYIINKSNIAGYFREDTLSRKIYVVPKGHFIDPCDEENEFLLYDYSLKQGDSFNPCVGKWIGAGQFSDTYSYVDSIVETVHINGRAGRFFYTFGAFRPCGLVIPRVGALVEGFGFEDGPIYGWHNRTFIDYCEGTFEQCNIISSAKEMNSSANWPLLSPNPVSEYLKIISVENFVNVHIYNTCGKLILVSIDEQINVSDFIPGLYFAKIFTSDKTFNLRFIKI